MMGLLQRVCEAKVEVGGEVVGAIDKGLMVLVGVERDDTPAAAERLADRLLGYRVFSDGAGKMNCSVKDVDGGVLLVPQFTLPADTGKGMRPSFSSAAAPTLAAELFEHMHTYMRKQHHPIESGRFGAHMKVSLTNDGPVTFLLKTQP